ncbi:MAG TPA: hypothetical protein V6C65_31540, partial [Allocoleopsis sp.]
MKQAFNKLINRLADTLISNSLTTSVDKQRIESLRDQISKKLWDKYILHHDDRKAFAFAEKMLRQKFTFDDAALLFQRFSSEIDNYLPIFTSGLTNRLYNKLGMTKDPVMTYANYLLDKYLEAANERGLPLQPYQEIADQILGKFKDLYPKMSKQMQEGIRMQFTSLMQRIKDGLFLPSDQEVHNSVLNLANLVGEKLKLFPVRKPGEEVVPTFEDPTFNSDIHPPPKSSPSTST